MRSIVIGNFFSLNTKKAGNGQEFFELRVTQQNDLGINTEVFNIWDSNMAMVLAKKSKGDFVFLECDVYLRNGFLQKRVHRVFDDLQIVDKDTGEVLAAS